MVIASLRKIASLLPTTFWFSVLLLINFTTSTHCAWGDMHFSLRYCPSHGHLYYSFTVKILNIALDFVSI